MRDVIHVIKYNIHNLVFVLQRTVLAPFRHVSTQSSSKCQFGKRVFFAPYTRMYNSNNESVVIGDNTSIFSYTKIGMCGYGGKLQLGNNCSIGEHNVFNVFADITLGDNVLTADYVNFVTNNHKYRDISKPIMFQGNDFNDIYVGSDSWIGINATILGGTHLGKHCIVGANSVVKGIFPDYSVIVGNPGRIIKYFDINKNEWIRNE